VFPPEPVLAPGRWLPAGWRQRLLGRYGMHAHDVVAEGAAACGVLGARIPGTETLWAELVWAARAEAVVHLEDLLLRRTRLGLLLKGGGVEHMERIRALCQRELGWSDERWAVEESAYLALWKTHYGLPADYA
jgi:glycerol-3-phosphate dehydrogenase